jgi:hypothetical protein
MREEEGERESDHHSQTKLLYNKSEEEYLTYLDACEARKDRRRIVE